jgi:hypothetical protein
MAKRKWGDVRRHGRTASNISFLFQSSDLNSGTWRVVFFIIEFIYLGGRGEYINIFLQFAIYIILYRNKDM